MSDYEVVLSELAAAQLVEVRNRAAGPDAVVAAFLRIERRLQTRPKQSIDVLTDEFYGLSDGPLRLTFTVRGGDRTALIESARLLPGHARWTRPGATGPK